MKCFEIVLRFHPLAFLNLLTVNMKCFEIGTRYTALQFEKILTVNMKCFEIFLHVNILTHFF